MSQWEETVNKAIMSEDLEDEQTHCPYRDDDCYEDSCDDCIYNNPIEQEEY